MVEIAADLMSIQIIAHNVNVLKEEEGEVEELQVWVVETIMQRIVQIVPRAMERLGAMGSAIGSVINVCLYDVVLTKPQNLKLSIIMKYNS